MTANWATYKSYLEGEPTWYHPFRKIMSDLPWFCAIVAPSAGFVAYSQYYPTLPFDTNVPLYILLAISGALFWLALYGNEFHWAVSYELHLQLLCVLRLAAIGALQTHHRR